MKGRVPLSAIDRILFLISEKGISANRLSLDLRLSNSAITDWKKGRAKPSTDAINKIADYFDVSTDYLLGRTDNRAPQPLIIPEELRGVRVAFHRGEFEGLTQDEVDALAILAKTLKQQRLGKEGD